MGVDPYCCRRRDLGAETMRKHSEAIKNMLPALLVVVAIWPVWPWYRAAAFRTGGDPWPVLALVAAMAVAWKLRGDQHPYSRLQLTLSCILMLIYGLTYHQTPFLLSALVGFFALSLALASQTKQQGSWLALAALMALSLPIFDTLQFLVGFPLRVVSAEIACFILRFSGFDVARQGVALVFHQHEVLIDPACSGLRTLWTSLFLAALVAPNVGLRLGRTLKLFFAAIFLAIIASAFRASSLAFWQLSELFRESWDGLVHTSIGLFVFAFVAWSLARVAIKMGKRENKTCPV